MKYNVTMNNTNDIQSKTHGGKTNGINDDQSKIIKRNKDKIAARIYREKMSKALQERESLLNEKENKNNLLREDIRRLEEEVKICKKIHEQLEEVSRIVRHFLFYYTLSLEKLNQLGYN